MTRSMNQDAAETVLRRTMVLLLLLLMFSSSSFPSVTAECPDKCSCEEELTVFCDFQGLDRIPVRIPPATKLLDLNYNKIRDIESLANLTELQSLDLAYNEIRDIKSLAHLTKLRFLELSFNKIRDIEPKSFTHLTELETLFLSNNNISEVKNGAFSNLSKLQLLRLSGNKIENIEIGVFNNLTSLNELHLDENQIHKLDLEMFKGLPKLYLLSLENNMISNIPPGIFDSLTSLSSLSLENNMISNIPPGMFDSLTSLSRLGLDDNPLKCDCNMLLFVNALKKSLTEGNLALTGRCNPFYLYRIDIYPTSLKEITENDLNCTPDIIVVPENKTVLVGEQLQLSCIALGDPEPFITWAKDDIDLELGQRVQVLQNNTLIISKVERTDGGQYKCMASNSFGRKSFEATVNVNGLAENGCNTMFGAIPVFFIIIIIILANCLLYKYLCMLFSALLDVIS